MYMYTRYKVWAVPLIHPRKSQWVMLVKPVLSLGLKKLLLQYSTIVSFSSVAISFHTLRIQLAFVLGSSLTSSSTDRQWTTKLCIDTDSTVITITVWALITILILHSTGHYHGSLRQLTSTNATTTTPAKQPVFSVESLSVTTSNKDTNLCELCEEEPINVRFHPCKHSVLCELCAERATKCLKCKVILHGLSDKLKIKVIFRMHADSNC